MHTINDPMFALILRFVGGNQKIAFEDDKFIKKELKVIQSYIEQFPPEERELRAIEWIEAHSYGYFLPGDVRIVRWRSWMLPSIARSTKSG